MKMWYDWRMSLDENSYENNTDGLACRDYKARE